MRTHQSCRGRHCALGDTHRPQSLGGTSLRDRTGMVGNNWHRTPLESSLFRERRRQAGIRGAREQQSPPQARADLEAGAWSSPSAGTFQAEMSGPAWGAETTPMLGVAGPAMATLAELGTVGPPVS